MANSKFFIFLVVIVILLTSCPDYSSSSVIPSSSSSVVPSSPPNVSVSVFYDAIDNSSITFLPEFIYCIYKQGLYRIVNLKLFPYATARIGADSSVICQGGTQECYISRVEICGMKYLPDQWAANRLIICISFFLRTESIEENWEKCFELNGLEEKRVKQCFTGIEGKNLEYEHVKQTRTLIHGVGHLPWITVDGVQEQNLSWENLKSSICKAYKGKNTESCRAKDDPKIPGSCSGIGGGAIFAQRLP